MRVIVCLLIVLAGCTGQGSGVTPVDEVDDMPPSYTYRGPFGGLDDPLVVDHPHARADGHDATANISRLAFTTPATGASGVGYAEADLSGVRLAVATTLGRMFVLDVSTPEAPVTMQEIVVPGYVADVKWAGDLLLAGTQSPGHEGILAFDLSGDGAAPAGAVFIYGGCHMISVQADIVFCAGGGSGVTMYEIGRGTPTVFTLVATYDPHPATLVAGVPDPVSSQVTHDMTAQLDPLTGHPVLVVSTWYDGVHVLDVADPSKPVLLGKWVGEGADTFEGNTHTSMLAAVEGRRVLAMVPEFTNWPGVYFVDATEYGAMAALGAWLPRTSDEWAGEASTFTSHNFQFVEGRIYMALSHGGIWVIDASSVAALKQPQALGYYLHHEAGAAPGNMKFWDVVIGDGVMYGTDAHGVAVLRYGDDAGFDSFA